MGLLLIKPAGLLLFYTGADTSRGKTGPLSPPSPPLSRSDWIGDGGRGTFTPMAYAMGYVTAPHGLTSSTNF